MLGTGRIETPILDSFIDPTFYCFERGERGPDSSELQLYIEGTISFFDTIIASIK